MLMTPNSLRDNTMPCYSDVFARDDHPFRHVPLNSTIIPSNVLCNSVKMKDESTKEVLSEFIELYKSYLCLWRVKLK